MGAAIEDSTAAMPASGSEAPAAAEPAKSKAKSKAKAKAKAKAVLPPAAEAGPGVAEDGEAAEATDDEAVAAAKAKWGPLYIENFKPISRAARRRMQRKCVRRYRAEQKRKAEAGSEGSSSAAECSSDEASGGKEERLAAVQNAGRAPQGERAAKRPKLLDARAEGQALEARAPGLVPLDARGNSYPCWLWGDPEYALGPAADGAPEGRPVDAWRTAPPAAAPPAHHPHPPPPPRADAALAGGAPEGWPAGARSWAGAHQPGAYAAEAGVAPGPRVQARVPPQGWVGACAAAAYASPAR
ncbi:unnamed protein product [Prorocentrum cordatum]|uniref:Uncharacterized protein n=1 Tax=Prorocentrum cordatum TaxID=2364126 RepID=A0ABN9XCA2_9DINO|nr:unnamed protein product [Polarella glacialis]